MTGFQDVTNNEERMIFVTLTEQPMKPEDFFKMREEQKKKEAEMSPEELAALNAARKRHARRVRDEIMTSYELDQQKKNSLEEE